MLHKFANGPLMFVKITPEETEIAKKIKEEFKVSLDKLKDAFNILKSFKDALTDEHPSKEDLENKYKGRFLRYSRKIRQSFNDFLLPTKSILNMVDKITDPNMERIRSVVIAEISEMSEGIDMVLDLLKDPAQKDFTSTIEELFAQIEKRKVNIHEAVEHQLFGHIDQNILGKLKISSIIFDIKRRKRIIKSL